MADRLIIGCGYLGLRVVAAWVQAGQRVYATTRRRSASASFVPSASHRFWQMYSIPIVCVLCRQSLQSCIASASIAPPACRCAWSTSMVWPMFNGPLPLPKRFIYVSSTSSTAKLRAKRWTKISATVPRDESGGVVLAAETLLHERLPGAIVLRFAGIYGPGRLLSATAIQAGEALPRILTNF